MSTGAWIFATAALVLAVGAPISYAAVSSTVAIGNTDNNNTATVTAGHQLLTTTIAPKNVVAVQGFGLNGCQTFYTPPAGKAIVVTSVTYDVYANTTDDVYSYLASNGCNTLYDTVETHLAAETETRTFPIGLPMPNVALFNPNGKGVVDAYITGYLIPVSQLPATTPAAKLPSRLAHATH